jgi:hypothetical protein
MAETTEPTSPILQGLIEENASVMERAFKEGYRLGYEHAYATMRRSLAGGLQQVGIKPQPSPASSKKALFTPLRIAPPNIEPNSYGAVINTMRHALAATAGSGIGITAQQFLQYCRDQKINTTMNSVRDCIKRLKGGDEVESMGGAYYAAPGLRKLEPAPVSDETPELGLNDGEKDQGGADPT